MQISRFFKDFGDFEVTFTPSFRHPNIKGGDDLNDIGILEELKKLKLNIESKEGN